MLKLHLISLGLWSLLSLTIWAQVPLECPVKNHIFLIHGISGSAETFGSLKPYLNNLDSCYFADSFEYDTGNSKLTTRDFAQRFHLYVKGKFDQGVIRSQDKISLIMHSQGGLVGSFWLSMVRHMDPILFSKIDAFITLSTPFWGAEMANLGGRIFFALPGMDSNPLSPFGKKELNEMSYGSESIKQLSEEYEFLFGQSHIRFLSLGGKKILNNELIGEDDGVVPLYSSRPDHYGVFINGPLEEPRRGIASIDIQRPVGINFKIVDAEHFKLDLPGIANIPSSCLKEKKCRHPSLPFIMAHLNGETISESNEDLRRFRVTIFLTDASGTKLELQKTKIEIETQKGVSVPSIQALRSHRGKAKLQSGKAFSFYGVSLVPGEQEIRVKLKLEGKSKRTIQIPIEGGHSSFVHFKISK